MHAGTNWIFSMTYRSIVVHIARDTALDARLEVAIRLAKDMDSHLVGLAPTGLIAMPITLEPAAIETLSEAAQESMRKEAGLAEARFREACRQAGLKSHESVVDEADLADSIVRHAHCSDLCIVSQPDPDKPGHRWARLQLEQVILQCARPTLIVPYAWRPQAVGRNVLVAWDDSREAARAVADALPVLRRAQKVEVISWRKPTDLPIPEARLQSVCRWLMWQGVAAQARAEVSDIGVAETMLSRASELGSDLIVMGAYGHARWSEIVLGGATRGLLDAMTVPVLLSH